MYVQTRGLYTWTVSIKFKVTANNWSSVLQHQLNQHLQEEHFNVFLLNLQHWGVLVHLIDKFINFVTGESQTNIWVPSLCGSLLWNIYLNWLGSLKPKNFGKSWVRRRMPPYMHIITPPSFLSPNSTNLSSNHNLTYRPLANHWQTARLWSWLVSSFMLMSLALCLWTMASLT